MASKSGTKVVDLVGMVIGFIILVIGGYLVGVTPLGTVNSNPYLSKVSDTGVLYAVLFGVGFVIFVTFLHVWYEDTHQ